MNNPKDLPFAACATAALAVMAGIPASYPLLTLGRVLALGLSIGLALSVRPGGMLLLAYAGVVVVVQVVRSGDFAPRHLLVTASLFLLATAVATTVPLPFWPWLQSHPYTGLLDALSGVSHFQWRGMMIFNGSEVHSMRLPWTYVPLWLLYTTPLVTMCGVALALCGLARLAVRGGLLWPWTVGVCGLLAAALFPIVYVIAKQSTLYDGIRHLLFIQPSLTVLASVGWLAVLNARRQTLRRAAALVLALGLAEPVIFALRNHPNEIVYFNPLIGRPSRGRGSVRARLLGQLSLSGAAGRGHFGDRRAHAGHCLRSPLAADVHQRGALATSDDRSAGTTGASHRVGAAAWLSETGTRPSGPRRSPRVGRDRRWRAAVRGSAGSSVCGVRASSESQAPLTHHVCARRPTPGLWGSMPLHRGVFDEH